MLFPIASTTFRFEEMNARTLSGTSEVLVEGHLIQGFTPVCRFCDCWTKSKQSNVKQGRLWTQLIKLTYDLNGRQRFSAHYDPPPGGRLWVFLRTSLVLTRMYLITVNIYGCLSWAEAYCIGRRERGGGRRRRRRRGPRKRSTIWIVAIFG